MEKTDIQAKSKARIPVLPIVLRNIPERPSTPVSTLQSNWLAGLVTAALKQGDQKINLEFGQWLADTLKQIRKNPEKQTKLAHFLQASVQTVTSQKTVAGVSLKVHSFNDLPVISPMIAVLINQSNPQDTANPFQRFAIDYDHADSPDMFAAQGSQELVASQQS